MTQKNAPKDKVFEVVYGKDKYTCRALPTSTVALLGFRLQPKLIGLTIVSGGIALDKFNQGENINSYYDVISKVFEPSDWEWLMEEILYNENYPLQVNGIYLNREEVEKHFAGDFCRLYTVLLKLAYLNLGEFKDLLGSLTGATKSIVTSLQNITEQHLKGLEQSFKKYETHLTKPSAGSKH